MITPCSRCGSTERYASSRNCRPCALARAKRFRIENREKHNAQNREHYLRTIDKQKARAKKYAAENREAMRVRQREWVVANPEKAKAYARNWVQNNLEKSRMYSLKWQAKNRSKATANQNRRRAAFLLATPSWANEFFIEQAYELAKLRERVCGGKWHVDHIVPLRSKLVCGLHVEHNLQVIPKSVNQAKGNRHWPNQP